MVRGILFTLLCIATAVQFRTIAAANPAPVAVPGDMVRIGPPHRWPAPSVDFPAHLLATAWAGPGPSCRLDLGVMAHPGGVLTVLAVRPDGVMLSWSGGRTARGGASCHPGAGGILISDAHYSGLLMKWAPRR